MHKGRLEAFSDGVFAIIITIMVLELRAPATGEVSALRPLLPIFLSYLLSFLYIGIYWNNHHHMFKVTPRITGGILWANLHLLFWVSLFPFVTDWLGKSHGATWQTVLYGIVLFMAATAYFVLQTTIIKHQGDGSLLAKAIGRDFKGKASIVIYAAAVCLAFVNVRISQLLFLLVALMWLVPDRRIERIQPHLNENSH
jgi:uncharacterized membrane protein